MTTPNPETVTIAKAEFETLKRVEAILNKGFNDRTAKGASFRRQLKEFEPALNIPEEIADTAAAPLKSEIDEIRAENKKLLERLDTTDRAEADEKSERELRKDIDAAVKKFGLDDEGKQKVIERMVAKHSTDAEAAAAWFKSTLHKPEITRDTGMFPKIMDVKDVFGTAEGTDDDIALLHKDPMRFFDVTAQKILNEGAQEAA